MQILEKQQKIREQLIECRNKYAELTEANEEKTVEKHLNDYGEKCLKLVLLAEPGQSYCLDIEYESREATWSPSYEIRVESGETQANVYLYANIDKTSDEPWENVNLTVSTGITQAFDPYILEGLKPMTLVKKIPKPMFMPEPSEFPLGAQFEDDKQIAQIGSDDVWRKDKLEKQVVFLEQNPQYAVCFSWIETIDENSHIVKGAK